jgi:hypothetical protein
LEFSPTAYEIQIGESLVDYYAFSKVFPWLLERTPTTTTFFLTLSPSHTGFANGPYE